VAILVRFAVDIAAGSSLPRQKWHLQNVFNIGDVTDA